MTTMLIPILITLAILGLVMAIIVRPLYTMTDRDVNASEQQKIALSAEYQQTLNRIRELEQENLEGKLADVDYQDRRSALNNDAVRILKQLENDRTGTP